MATQSLYRRYRPRRFDELRGQEHIVHALREAVKTGREGQAYLFSGPPLAVAAPREKQSSSLRYSQDLASKETECRR